MFLLVGEKEFVNLLRNGKFKTMVQIKNKKIKKKSYKTTQNRKGFTCFKSFQELIYFILKLAPNLKFPLVALKHYSKNF
jgi:hypothetical protein